MLLSHRMKILFHAHVEQEIINKINQFNQNEKLNISLHTVFPEKNIRNGDPYQWQIEKTVQKIIEKIKY